MAEFPELFRRARTRSRIVSPYCAHYAITANNSRVAESFTRSFLGDNNRNNCARIIAREIVPADHKHSRGISDRHMRPRFSLEN
jgi:hypothetical protein